jgi:hypothetical protein
VKIKEVIGQTFGELLVLEDYPVHLGYRSRRYLKCKCTCGKITEVEKAKVLRGYTKSCGHLQAEMRHNLGSLNKLPYGEACMNETYECYKKNALKRNYEFKLTKEEFKKVVTGPCFYCGNQNTQEKGDDQSNGKFKYTGIDRYDNTKGYTTDNCVPCCRTCNMMKGTMTAIEFKERMETILASEFWKRK